MCMSVCLLLVYFVNFRFSMSRLNGQLKVPFYQPWRILVLVSLKHGNKDTGGMALFLKHCYYLLLLILTIPTVLIFMFLLFLSFKYCLWFWNHWIVGFLLYFANSMATMLQESETYESNLFGHFGPDLCVIAKPVNLFSLSLMTMMPWTIVHFLCKRWEFAKSIHTHGCCRDAKHDEIWSKVWETSSQFRNTLQDLQQSTNQWFQHYFLAHVDQQWWFILSQLICILPALGGPHFH